MPPGHRPAWPDRPATPLRPCRGVPRQGRAAIGREEGRPARRGDRCRRAPCGGTWRRSRRGSRATSRRSRRLPVVVVDRHTPGPARRRMVEEVLDHGSLLAVDPADDLPDAHPAASRGIEIRRDALASLRVPVVGVGDAVARRLDRLDHPRRRPQRALPRSAGIDDRPGRRVFGAATRRVVDPDLPSLSTVLDGGGEQVALDRRGDDRAAPLEERRDGESGGLAAAARPDDRERRLRLAGEEAPARPPERDPTRLRLANDEAAEVTATSEARVGRDPERPAPIGEPLPAPPDAKLRSPRRRREPPAAQPSSRRVPEEAGGPARATPASDRRGSRGGGRWRCRHRRSGCRRRGRRARTRDAPPAQTSRTTAPKMPTTQGKSSSR